MKTSSNIRQELIDLTRDLVKIRSVNPPGSEARAAEYVEEYLDSLGIATVSVLLDGDPERRSVLGTIPGEREGSVVLCGHLDTVGVTEEHWSLPPFDGLVRDGRIYGRGTADMKGGLAVMLCLARLIKESGVVPEKDLVLAFTADEEQGYGGASSLVEEGLLDGAEFLVITEPTDGRVYLGEKGELWVEVTFSGKAAHGSTPGLGINAVLAGSDFSLKLNSRVKEWNCDELRGCTTLNVGQFDGGWQVNIVPDRATIKLDFRVISTDQKELALNTIGEIASEVVDKLGGDFNKETISYQDPIVSDPEDGYIEGFFRAAGLTPDGGNRSAPLIVPYCTDAAAIVPELGVPLILYGPGAIEMAHKPDEYVEIKSLIESLETFTNFFKVTK